MQPTIHLSIVLPIMLQILQALVLLLLAITILRKRKLIVEPIGAMDYSTVIFCSSILFGVLLISAGDSVYFLRAYKSVVATDNVWGNTFSAFSRYFLTTICATALFVGLTFIAAELFSRGKSREEFAGGNIPLGIFCSGIALGLAFVMNSIATPVYEWLTPVYLNFR